MMEFFHRYRALNAADRWLIVEAAILLAVVRMGLAALQFPVLQRALDRAVRIFARNPSDKSVSPATRLAWAVAAVARRRPFRSTCLGESLAVDAMLRRRGYASRIRFGVRPPSGSALAGHAWVEHEGIIVSGALHDLAEYSELSARDAE